jgi:hypothetical protein
MNDNRCSSNCVVHLEANGLEVGLSIRALSVTRGVSRKLSRISGAYILAYIK